MGAEEILKFLKKNKEKEFTALEISETIEKNRRTVARILASLLKESEQSREIKFRHLTNEEKKQKYNRILSREIKVYFIDLS